MEVLGTPPDDFMSKISSESVSLRSFALLLIYRCFTRLLIHWVRGRYSNRTNLNELLKLFLPCGSIQRLYLSVQKMWTCIVSIVRGYYEHGIKFGSNVSIELVRIYGRFYLKVIHSSNPWKSATLACAGFLFNVMIKLCHRHSTQWN